MKLLRSFPVLALAVGLATPALYAQTSSGTTTDAQTSGNTGSSTTGTSGSADTTNQGQTTKHHKSKKSHKAYSTRQQGSSDSAKDPNDQRPAAADAHQ